MKLVPCKCGKTPRVYEAFSNASCTKSEGWNVECSHCSLLFGCGTRTREGAIRAWNEWMGVYEREYECTNCGRAKCLLKTSVDWTVSNSCPFDNFESRSAVWKARDINKSSG